MNGTKKLVFFIICILFVFGNITAGSIVDLVEKGDTDAVMKMVKKDKTLLDAKNERGRSLIHIAAAKGHLAIIKFLIKNGADVNLEEKSHQLRPLNFASRFGRFEVVKFLLDNGADLYAREKDNRTVLPYAVASTSLDTVKYLISKGAKVTGKDENGWTMLHSTAWRGKKEMIELLIKSGIYPNVKSNTGFTPLHGASSAGNLEAIEAFIKNGADPNTIDDKGNSPLSNAVSSGHIKAVAMLLKSKADPNGKLEFMGVSPLHIAAGKGYEKIGAMLLKSGANFKALDDSGNTPLFYACRYKNKLMAKALLKAGAEKEDILKIFKKKNPANKQLEKGTAIIWYTGHSGWAIKTEKNLLIFDYWKRNAISDTPSLMNGAIDPEEIKDLNVSVFISHEHADHYMPAVFDWKHKVTKINYYTGFTPKDKSGYKFLKPQKTWKLDRMEVTTIESTDTGVAFLVKVDGLVIYHSGDHANMRKDMSGKFKPATDYLLSLGLTPDIYFAPVSGCNFRDKVALMQGVYYTIKKMRPKAVFPMHGGSTSKSYINFIKAAKQDGVNAPFYYPLVEGDRFFYKGGKVKGMNKLKLVAKDVKKKKKKKCNPGCK